MKTTRMRHRCSGKSLLCSKDKIGVREKKKTKKKKRKGRKSYNQEMEEGKNIKRLGASEGGGSSGGETKGWEKKFWVAETGGLYRYCKSISLLEKSLGIAWEGMRAGGGGGKIILKGGPW